MKITDSIIKKHQFNHPIDKVWNAISSAEEISKWFIKAEFKAEEGFNYLFTHEDTKITGRVLKANPVYELVYTWKIMGTEIDTEVKWLLEENEKGTLLTLEHSGISKYPGESAVAMFNNYEGGWVTCISELKKYLN